MSLKKMKNELKGGPINIHLKKKHLEIMKYNLTCWYEQLNNPMLFHVLQKDHSDILKYKYVHSPVKKMAPKNIIILIYTKMNIGDSSSIQFSKQN